jgi:hypothetical protein
MRHYADFMTTKERLQWIRIKTVFRLLRKKIIEKVQAIELLKARDISHAKAMVEQWKPLD